MQEKLQGTQDAIEKNVENSFSKGLESEMDTMLGKGSYSMDLSVKKEMSLWNIDVSVRSARGHIAVSKSGGDLDYLMEEVRDLLNKKVQTWYELNLIDTFKLNTSHEFDMFNELKNEDQNRIIKNPHHMVLRVLIVEDDPVAGSVIQTMLKHIGCQTKLVSEPREALNQALTRGYDLMVLDWNLPYQTGQDLLKELDAKMPALPKKLMPVIICSGLSIDEIEFPKLRNLFLVDYWSKTFSFSSVVSSVEKTIRALETWMETKVS
jgi:CheY-like chemotaxis protein